MLHTTNIRVIEIRDTFRKIRKLINFSIIILAALSFIYLVYWTAVMSDDMVLDYTASYFNPLAQFFFPSETSVDIYRSTGIALALLILPFGFLYYIADKIEAALIKKENRIQEVLENNRKKQEHINSLMQYEVIDSYSICLSLDYESKKIITEETKAVLNNIVFQKIKKILNLSFEEAKVNAGNVLIVTSRNFEKYDYMYSMLLRALAKIKAVIEHKYELKIIPNITSDAYTQNEPINSIERYHKEIKKLNFKNRALSTAMFLKKYKYLKHNKYAGIPIGEYALFKDGSMGTYELNIVFKNLSQTLASIS